jgi:hypothetical protein
MGLALSGVGYDDALFVDNGAYTRVRTIARIIKYDPNLGAAFNSGGVHNPLVKQFLISTLGKSLEQIRKLVPIYGGLTKAELAQLRNDRGADDYINLKRNDPEFWRKLKASGKKSTVYGKITPAARRAIADALGVGAAYRRAEARKEHAYRAGAHLGGDANRDARVAARKAAWTEFGQASTDVVRRAEARRAAARKAHADEWAATDSLTGEEQKKARSKFMQMYARGARVTPEERKAKVTAAFDGMRSYGPYTRSEDSKARTKNRRAGAAASTAAGGSRAKVQVRPLSASEEAQAASMGIVPVRGATNVYKSPGYVGFMGPDQVRSLLGRGGGGGSRGTGIPMPSPRSNPGTHNPFGSLSADDFGAVALSNPLIGAGTESTGIDLFDSLEAKASSLPGGMVLGPVAALAAPVAFGVGASAVHLFVVPKLVMPHLPEKLQPFAYSITGSAVGVAAGLASTHINHRQARAATQMVGGAAALIGVGIDLYRNNFFGLLGGRSSDTAGIALSGEMGDSDDDEGEFGAVALSGNFGAVALSGDFGAVALSGDLGDGGAYQIQPVGADGMFGAVQKHYADAMYGDATVCGPDLNEAEGNAVLSGVGAFFGTFGQTPQSAMRVNTGVSRHAGREGHRWGWLIKLVGWQEFHRIAALPPAERCAVIEQMRVAAIEAAKGGIAKQEARLLASRPIEAPEALGPRGANTDYANADAFGALMVAGPGGY